MQKQFKMKKPGYFLQIFLIFTSLFRWRLLLVPVFFLQPVLLHVCFHLPYSTPPLCIQGQELTKHLHGFWSEPSPQRRNILLGVGPLLQSAPVSELLVEVVGVHAVLPGEVASEDAEDDHPEGPGVQAGLHTQRRSSHFFLAVLQGHSAKLRCHVGQGSRDETNHGASLLGKAKVCQLDLTAVAVQQEDVFRLDVSVDQAVAVDEVQSTGNLKDAAFYRGFWDTHLEELKTDVFVAFLVYTENTLSRR